MQFNETDFGVAGEPWVYCIADQCSNDLGLSRCGLPPPKATLVRGQAFYLYTAASIRVNVEGLLYVRPMRSGRPSSRSARTGSPGAPRSSSRSS
ncbi:hypothetical protein PAPYR_13512 [Paratrimastix pyriformis]|uniref:Uncharacterized protein n=1 Tax=Paratrimastix pyriformis TaxID=342808 RepID=A0ABQ8U1N7_9EUKA|nr:hypothetical protein PAPYR_13512 [Paratrimastix pyriformis]